MEVKVKECFRCHRILPLDKFYRNKGMPDGHINKCADCAKKEQQDRYNTLCQDPEWVERERTRGRDKYHRLNYREKKTAAQTKKYSLYPRLRAAKRYWECRAVVVPEGYELHHWNYNHVWEVFVLPKIVHKRVHSKLKISLDEGIYYYEGKPLDTIEKHAEVVKMVCEKYGFDFSNVRVLTP